MEEKEPEEIQIEEMDASWAKMQRLGLHSDELDNEEVCEGKKGPRDMTM